MKRPFKHISAVLALLLLLTSIAPFAMAQNDEEDKAFVVQIAAGGKHSFALKNDGSLWAWGSNLFGQLGDGSTRSTATPVKVLDDVSFVSAGFYHSLAIKTDGSLWTWGGNMYGQLGDGTTEEKTTPVKIMENVITADAGMYHSMAVQKDGSLWAWGQNDYGQLGDIK
jgi:alpha-tubulin suppressor-like RCC1 family protein